MLSLAQAICLKRKGSGENHFEVYLLETMAATMVTSLKAPLVTPKHGEEEGIRDVSFVLCPDQEEDHFQIGGPIWCGIQCFMMHAIIGIFVSSFSYIPYVGESPVWVRVTILVANFLTGFLDHLGAGITSTHSKLDNLWKAMVLPGLLGLILFFSKLYTALPAWESTSLVFIFIVLLVGPGVVYKKATGKEAPAVHSEIMDSLTTWAGVALHNGADTALALYFVLCWNLMGSPLLMGWLQ
jgi:hypothetical protein